MARTPQLKLLSQLEESWLWCAPRQVVPCFEGEVSMLSPASWAGQGAASHCWEGGPELCRLQEDGPG